MLIAGFPDEMWMLQQLERRNFRLPQKEKTISKSSDKTSSTRGSLDAMFLVDMICTQTPGSLASENSDQMIRFNLFSFLSGKKCSSICPEKTTENSIQMVNAPDLDENENFARYLFLCDHGKQRLQNDS